MIENGNTDIRLLTAAQLEKYEFRVKVSEGSSELQDNVKEVLTKLATEAFSKMSGTEAVITILGLAAIVATTWGIISYLQGRKEIRLDEIASEERRKTIESFNATSSENAATFRDIINIMRVSGDAPRRAADAAEDIQSQRLRAASLTNVTEFGGVKITRDEAKELRAGTKAQVHDINGDKRDEGC